MKKHTLIRNLLVLSLLFSSGVRASESLDDALREFASYEFGQEQMPLQDAREVVFEGTNDESVRMDHEQSLLTFVQSTDASVIARRQACLWLADVGSDVSLPVLKKLGQQADFSDVAQIAMDGIQATSASDAAPVGSDTAKAIAKMLASPAPGKELAKALSGSDELLARAVFDLIDRRVPEGQSAAWLSQQIEQLPANRQIIALDILMRMDDPVAKATIRRIAREGQDEVNLHALSLLGFLQNSDDFAYVAQQLSAEDGGLAGSAEVSVIRFPQSFSNDFFLKELQSASLEEQARCLAILLERGGEFPTEPLLKIAKNSDHPGNAAALTALAKIAEPQGYEAVLVTYLDIQDQAQSKKWMKCLFDISRRYPDYDALAKVFTAKKAMGTADKQAVLDKLVARLLALKPGELFPKKVSGPSFPSYQNIVPTRFKVAAYLNAGERRKAVGNGIRITLASGQPWNAAYGVDPSQSVHFDPQSLEYLVKGLDKDKDYVIGMTLWDSGLAKRRQSLSFDGEVVIPELRPIAYDAGKPTPARIQLALPSRFIEDGTLQVALGVIGGSNAVLSELWIAERQQPKAPKQVLLVTGEDYPTHFWHKTQQVMKDLIEEDSSMEVTICESPYVLSYSDLKAYDVVFLHFKNYSQNLPSTAAMHQGLKQFLELGGGMCMSHFACGAFQEWPEFVQFSGRVWNGTGHDNRGPFTVKIVDTEHPITEGLSDFETDDELYFCLMGAPEVHVLCDAFSKKKQENHPQALVYLPGKGRVFLSTLGHDVKAYDAPSVRKLYRQGTAWAASQK